MFTLYFAPGSSSFAVHIALHEIGVPFGGKPMSFKNDDLRSPCFLALNPEGKVPTFIIDGRPLTEVAAILYYLAKRFPDAGWGIQYTAASRSCRKRSRILHHPLSRMMTARMTAALIPF